LKGVSYSGKSKSITLLYENLDAHKWLIKFHCSYI